VNTEPVKSAETGYAVLCACGFAALGHGKREAYNLMGTHMREFNWKPSHHMTNEMNVFVPLEDFDQLRNEMMARSLEPRLFVVSSEDSLNQVEVYRRYQEARGNLVVETSLASRKGMLTAFWRAVGVIGLIWLIVVAVRAL
jgi:hypothetical protein